MSKWLDDSDGLDASNSLARPSSDGEERTILVVDDDHTVRDALSDLLEVLGYRVVAASDGLHALELLRTGCRPFIVLLDLAMPGMDGRQFRDALRNDTRFNDLLVVVITAAPNQRAEALGVAEVLEKPVPLERLLHLLESAARQQLA